MRKITIEVYRVNELPEEVREKVLDDYRYINVEDNWWDPLLETFDEKLKKIGLSADWKTLTFDLYRGEFKVDLSVDNIQDLLWAVVDRETKAKIMANALKNGDNILNDFFISFRDTGSAVIEFVNDFFTDELLEKIKSAIDNLVEEKFQSFLNALEEEYEYLTSDEAIIETLNINDYEFTKDGKQIFLGEKWEKERVIELEKVKKLL